MVKRKDPPILKDPAHWLGWVISSLAIFYALKLYLFIKKLETINPGACVLIFVIVVSVDYFKHKTNLQ